MHNFLNALTYFDTYISYMNKIFMKLTSGLRFEKEDREQCAAQLGQAPDFLDKGLVLRNTPAYLSGRSWYRRKRVCNHDCRFLMSPWL